MERIRAAVFSRVLAPVLIMGALLCIASPVLAADAPPSNPDGPKKIEVDALKQKYWAKGSEPDLAVVQNRIYTKAHKLQLEFDVGTAAGDPFLNNMSYGALLGFNFTESFGIDFFYWKLSSAHSSAYNAFVDATTTATTAGFGSNSNNLLTLMAGEVSWSVLYGKLSLLGKAILHFDLVLHGGAGQLATQNNTAIAPFIGIGQQLYLTRWLSFRADYRYLRYQENIVELFRPDTLGQVTGTKVSYLGAFTVGFNFLFF